MLIEAEESSWLEFTEKYAEHSSVFAEPAFTSLNARLFGLNVRYFLWMEKEEAMMGLAVYVRKHQIVVPHHFGYTGIVIAKENSRTPYLLQEMISELKRTFKRMDFRLQPSFEDTRPFLWEQFSGEVRYTYVKDTNDLQYQENIHRHIKKAQNAGIQYRQNFDRDTVLALHDTDLNAFGTPRHTRDTYLSLFSVWMDAGTMKSFDAILKDKLIGSILCLYDTRRSHAYLAMISRSENYYDTGVQSGLYDYTLQHLKSEGIRHVDFCGANIPGVARFKASFYPTLKPYHVLEYRNTISHKLYTKAGKLIRRLGI